MLHKSTDTPTYRIDSDGLHFPSNLIYEGGRHDTAPTASLSTHLLGASQPGLSSDPLVQADQGTGSVHNHLSAIQHKRH